MGRHTADDSVAPRAVVLIRAAVGGVFLSGGVQRFLFSGALGAGRFARIGIPAPDVMGPLVGGGPWSLDAALGRRCDDRRRLG